jgi:hypothetical protein
MCSTCCALGVVGEYCEHQFLLATDAVSRSFGELGRKDNILVILRKNEFGVYSSCLRRHITFFKKNDKYYNSLQDREF